jgi:hypothetical protein
LPAAARRPITWWRRCWRRCLCAGGGRRHRFGLRLYGGLIGASNSPISGVGILAALGIALVLLALFGHLADPAAGKALVAFALFVTALVFGVATISNDNLQDLKTGELVGARRGASRWRWCWAWCSARW